MLSNEKEILQCKISSNVETVTVFNISSSDILKTGVQSFSLSIHYLGIFLQRLKK